MAGAPDFAAEGLLEGLDGEARAARGGLLEHLHEAGVSLEDMRAAAAEERLALLPVEIVLGGEPRYTTEEVSERSAVPIAELSRLRQALGVSLPDPAARALTDDDLESAVRLAQMREAGVPMDAVVEVARVIGQSMAAVADAMRTLVAESAVRPGDDEREVALKVAALARTLVPMNGPILEYALTLHLREQLRTDFVRRAEVTSGRVLPGADEVFVAFADLVGFTRMGESRAPAEIGAVAGRLAEMAAAVADPPLRLIKTIGDAAMLAGPDAGALVEAALDLVDAAEREGEDFPLLRAGVAGGLALRRGGDWYGHPVNVASRVTAVARPASVLVSQEVHDQLDDAYRWSFAGERRLKGISEPVKLFRARRIEPGDDGRAT